ncbi:MAG: efflux RND transporter permease subunit [Candidatus Omnitrophota bacterium]
MLLGGKRQSGWPVLAPVFGWLIFTFSVLYFFIHYVDLKPVVDEHFFFSSDDPQFQSDKLISAIFPQPTQIIIGVKGDIHSPVYYQRIKDLTVELMKLEEVVAVESITNGPKNVQDAIESPLWKRVLISDDGAATFLQVFTKNIPAEEFVPKMEKIREYFSKPGFEVMVSGAPYIMELIRRYLMKDLEVFSGVALVVFGFVLFMIFGSFRILFGTLVACFNSSALTLLMTKALNMSIGPLTANISTIVFVLTLSPIVFLTYNWGDLAGKKQGSTYGTTLEAVKLTLQPAFWSMFTTLLGFVSCLFVQATPMRQFGIAGSLGTLIAFLSAFCIYPWFLRLKEGKEFVWSGRIRRHVDFYGWIRKTQGIVLFLMLAFAIFAGQQLPKMNADPNLFAYFKKGGEIRDGLEYIDHNGGSSPLTVVISAKGGLPLNTSEYFVKMAKLHVALEKHPEVGSAVSLPLIVAEAKRNRMASMLSTDRLIKILESPEYGEITPFFMTKDRTRTLFVLRMNETGRLYKRSQVVDQIRGIVSQEGLVPLFVGGIYLLQGKLSELLLNSIISGLILLVFIFASMGFGITRSVRTTLALLACLILVPVCMLGFNSGFRIPMDVISSPAANLAISMGIDAMLYMMIFVKRYRNANPRQEVRTAWLEGCRMLWKPVLSSMAIICSGFGIFALSAFPPTQRFGLSVVLGSLMVPLITLFVFPKLSTIWLQPFRRVPADED